MNKRKPRRTSQTPDLEDLLHSYDSQTLYIAAQSLQTNDVAWQLFKAYAKKISDEFKADALDLMAKTGSNQEAAYASGYSKCADDLIENFVTGLQKTILGMSNVVENDRPEE